MILFQRGATGWGFQFGRLYFQINYWRYCVFFRKHWTGKRLFRIGHLGWDRSDREPDEKEDDHASG